MGNSAEPPTPTVSARSPSTSMSITTQSDTPPVATVLTVNDVADHKFVKVWKPAYAGGGVAVFVKFLSNGIFVCDRKDCCEILFDNGRTAEFSLNWHWVGYLHEKDDELLFFDDEMKTCYSIIPKLQAPAQKRSKCHISSQKPILKSVATMIICRDDPTTSWNDWIENPCYKNIKSL